jgi:hypothetical protein
VVEKDCEMRKDSRSRFPVKEQKERDIRCEEAFLPVGSGKMGYSEEMSRGFFGVNASAVNRVVTSGERLPHSNTI